MDAPHAFSSLNLLVSIYVDVVLQHFIVFFVCLSEENLTIFDICDKIQVIGLTFGFTVASIADTPGLSTGRARRYSKYYKVNPALCIDRCIFFVVFDQVSA